MLRYVILSLATLAVTPFAAPASAQSECCQVENDGTGTTRLPPPCPYEGSMTIVDGLIPGSTIEIVAVLTDFVNPADHPGGSLNGATSYIDATLHLEMSGTGGLAGFYRNIDIPVEGVMDWGPRTREDPIQSFPAELMELRGFLSSDPDFDYIDIQAGTNFGLPSPGQTTLTRLGPLGSDFSVDSFFDITYRIDFAAVPGGALGDDTGVTIDQRRFEVCPGAVPVKPATWGAIKSLYP